MAGSIEWQEPVKVASPMPEKIRMFWKLGARVLQAGQLRHIVLQLLHEILSDLDASALRQIVAEKRQISGGGDGAIVLDDLVVSVRIEERRHAADSIGADSGCVLGKCYRAPGGLRSDVLNRDGPAAADVDADFGDAPVFVVVEVHAFTGAAGQPEAVDAAGDVVLENLSELYRTAVFGKSD